MCGGEGVELAIAVVVYIGAVEGVNMPGVMLDRDCLNPTAPLLKDSGFDVKEWIVNLPKWRLP